MNPTEFTQSGLLGYTEGNLGLHGIDFNATVNGYKYFAEGIIPTETLDEYFADPANGRLAKELDWTVIERRSGHKKDELRSSEKTSTTNRLRRVGEFEWDLLRKSASLNAPTDVALTFTDYLKKKYRNARRFEQLDGDTIQFIEEIERISGAPVSLISTRFHSRSIIDRRSW